MRHSLMSQTNVSGRGPHIHGPLRDDKNYKAWDNLTLLWSFSTMAEEERAEGQ